MGNGDISRGSSPSESCSFTDILVYCRYSLRNRSGTFEASFMSSREGDLQFRRCNTVVVQCLFHWYTLPFFASVTGKIPDSDLSPTARLSYLVAADEDLANLPVFFTGTLITLAHLPFWLALIFLVT